MAFINSNVLMLYNSIKATLVDKFIDRKTLFINNPSKRISLNIEDTPPI